MSVEDTNAVEGTGPETVTDVNTDVDASTTSQSDVNSETTQPSQVDQDVNQSAPSTDTGVKTETDKPTIRDRISDALDKISGKSTSEGPPAEEDKPKTEKSETDEDSSVVEDGEELSEEEKSAPEEVQSHPAFKAVIKERKEARAQRDEALAKAQQFEDDAKRYGQIQTFMETNSISDNDAAEALQLTALANQNPEQFYELMSQKVQKWGLALGKILPPDLQNQVDNGYITEELANELAATRGSSRVAQNRLQQSQARQQQQNQVQIAEDRTNLYNSWELQKKQADPDIENKLSLITDRVRSINAQKGQPQDAQEAWDRLEEAYKLVNDDISRFVPKPKPTPTIPQSGSTKTAAKAKPTTYDEAMSDALDSVFG